MIVNRTTGWRQPPDPPPPSAALIEQRKAAGAAYAASVSALEAAIIELAALDGLGATDNGLATFQCNPPDALPELRHREFLPRAPSRLQAKVRRRRDEIANRENIGSPA